MSVLYYFNFVHEQESTQNSSIPLLIPAKCLLVFYVLKELKRAMEHILKPGENRADPFQGLTESCGLKRRCCCFAARDHPTLRAKTM